MCVVYFRDYECDYVVLECGIGGWHSQTNFCDSDYGVITSVGLEHCNVLGDTEEEILKDKAGIIRDNIPFVIGPQVDVDVLQPIVEQHNAKLIRIEPEEGKCFLDYNKSIAYAVYQEILENETKEINQLNEEDLEIALNRNPP